VVSTRSQSKQTFVRSGSDKLLTIPSKKSIPIDGPKVFTRSTPSAFENSIEIVLKVFKKYNNNYYYDQLIPISGTFSSNDRHLCFHKSGAMKTCSTSLTAYTSVPLGKHHMGPTSPHVRVHNKNIWSMAYYGPCISY